MSIRPGAGYWDVTQYPKGGDFRRAKVALLLGGATVTAFFTDGSPREFVGIAPDGRRVCVSADVCDLTPSPR